MASSLMRFSSKALRCVTNAGLSLLQLAELDQAHAGDGFDLA